MDITFLLDYVNVVTLGICLCVGFVIKQSFTCIKNKYIPLIMLCVGTVINILCDWPNLNAVTVLAGMISGLASTGLYEAMRNLIDKEGKREE
ncbi:MAG: phage holin family protein [Velocimicrobium sp.]